MRQKNFTPQCFSLFYCFFHFIVKKDTEWTLLEKKKIKKEFNFISFFPLALSFVFWHWHRGCHAAPGSKKFKCQTVPLQVQVWKYWGRGGTKQVWETKQPSPPTPKGRCRGSGATRHRRRHPLLAVSVVWLGPEQLLGSAALGTEGLGGLESPVLPPSPRRSKIETAGQGSFLGASRFRGGLRRWGPLAGQGDEGTVQRLGFLGCLQPLRLPPVLASPQDVGRVPLPPLRALLLPHVVLGVLAVRGLLEALLQGEGQQC